MPLKPHPNFKAANGQLLKAIANATFKNQSAFLFILRYYEWPIGYAQIKYPDHIREYLVDVVYDNG
jgi:hypothetical protein